MAGKGGGLRFSGEATADGTGAATVDMVIPAAATKARAGWRILRAVVGNADASLPLTGGTVTLRDNGGAGTTFMTFTQATDGTKRELAAPSAVIGASPLRLTLASGGAGRKFQYLVEVG